MIIFLRNIPEKTKHSDIIAFIEPAMKKRWFQKKGEIINVRVMKLNDARTEASEFHGVVTIEPDKVGVQVVQALNRKRFLDKHIAVHEYQCRNWHNDLRLDQAVCDHERRKGERRHGDLQEAGNVSSQAASTQNFLKRYG
ncbi:MAG: RNA-binding protein [Methylococcaceae bacterium]|nr:RNA-binding protein [Methylococcaceae bacterium]